MEPSSSFFSPSSPSIHQFGNEPPLWLGAFGGLAWLGWLIIIFWRSPGVGKDPHEWDTIFQESVSLFINTRACFLAILFWKRPLFIVQSLPIPMSTPELKTYQGNCHCGAVKFTVKFPEVKAATACNCSICFKKGYLWLFPGTGDLTFERGEDTLSIYQFGSKAFLHKVLTLVFAIEWLLISQFCPNCGTGVMAVGERVGINVSQVLELLDMDVLISLGANPNGRQSVLPRNQKVRPLVS